MEEPLDKSKEAEIYIKLMAGGLLDYPDRLTVTSEIDERGVLVKIYVDKADLGRLIGKRGETVNAMRAVLRALGTKNDARYSLKVDDRDKINQIQGDRNDEV